MKAINVAIDGYSSCGKSTLAKNLAKLRGFIYIDTGAMYRAVTLFAMRQGLFSDIGLDESQLVSLLRDVTITFARKGDFVRTMLNGEDVEDEIRSLEVSNHVSQVSKIKAVRSKLKLLQQEMAKSGGVVMDGRDIGSAVLPDAELKIFMTADPEVRAKRRFDELVAKGSGDISMEDVKANLEKRDHIDTHRTEDPLIQVDDARVLDNTNLSRNEQLSLVNSWVESIVSRAR